jgi:hypothetical protein
MCNSDMNAVLELYIRWVVCGGVIDRVQQELGSQRRKGIYCDRVVLWLMLWQRLQARGTMSHAVRQLAQGVGGSLLEPCKRVREGRIAAAAGGYCQGIQKMSKEVPQQVTQDLVKRLSAEIGSPWPGLPGPVYVVDGTTLQLPSTRKLAEAYPPTPNQHGESHWPILRLLVLHDVSSGMALYPHWGAVFGAEVKSEQKLAAEAFAQIPGGSTILADRNFGVFSMAWQAQQRGLAVVVRLTKVRAYKLHGGPISQAGESAVVWKPGRQDQPQAAAWPEDAAVAGRLIAARVGSGRSQEWIYLFATVDLPAEEIVVLYGRRWNIETDLRSLKRTVHLQQLKARSVDGLEKELLSAICAYNLVRAVICLAARRAGLEARQLSFTQVLDLVNTAWPRLTAAQTKGEHDEYFERVLDWAAECRLPNRAKRRSYPRAVWGRGGQFPARKTK